MTELTFIDLFAGVGGFRRGMEMAGHRCLGHCEWDENANRTYEKIHEINEGEWFANDIRSVRSEEIPKADVWCFGFPCQDISNEGKKQGFSGQRSSLFFTVTGLIKELEEKDRPKYLFIENVKNLLSVNRGIDFTRLLVELDDIGYDAEWQVLKSVNFGCPQNRERVFIVGHFRGKCTREIFPIYGTTERSSREHTGSGLPLRNSTKKGYIMAYEGDGIDLSFPTSTSRRGRVQSHVSPTLMTSPCRGTLVGDRIRMLTPLEYWRLQGWTDDDYRKASEVCTEAQLYKQAGNGVTIPIIYEIAKKFI